MGKTKIKEQVKGEHDAAVVESLQRKIAELNCKVEEETKKAAAFKKTADEIETKYITANKKLGGLVRSNNVYQALTNELKDNIKSLEQLVKKLEEKNKKLVELCNEGDELNEQKAAVIDEKNKVINGLHSEVDALNRQYNKMAQDIIALTYARNDFEKKYLSVITLPWYKRIFLKRI